MLSSSRWKRDFADAVGRVAIDYRHERAGQQRRGHLQRDGIGGDTGWHRQRPAYEQHGVQSSPNVPAATTNECSPAGIRSSNPVTSPRRHSTAPRAAAAG